MRDPHVEWLRYKVTNDPHIIYVDPEPIAWSLPDFDVALSLDAATCTMTAHFATLQDARNAVEPFLSAWEVHAALNIGPGTLHFDYLDSHIVDRNPVPGKVLITGSGQISVTSTKAILTVTRRAYPAPPKHFRLTPDAETLWHRYKRYTEGKEPILSMGYFCLTVIEAAGGNRQDASLHFNVDLPVLRTLGELTSTRGDSLTARKAARSRTPRPLTDTEVAWVDSAVKLLIRRLGEWQPGITLPRITMAGLPQL